jgi:RNA polymerase sigma factor (sigma-70 family)
LQKRKTKHLLITCMSQQEQIFLGYIREHKRIIYKICNSYCSNQSDRQDLAQEIIYNLWKSFGSYDPAFRFSTWMYRVALNVAISFYRQEKKQPNQHQLSEELLVFEDDTGTRDETEKNLQLLQQFINELKEIDKAIILLYLDGHSHKEIAQVTGFTDNNVATRINRIKEKLRSGFITNKSN